MKNFTSPGRLLGTCALMLLFAALAHAVPMTLNYTVTPQPASNNFRYDFQLLVDNNDNSFQNGQGWAWLIFADQDGNGNNGTLLQNSALVGAAPGPWTTLGTTSGGHNGRSFNYVLDYWYPTGIGDQLTWTVTATNYIRQTELTWSTLQRTGSGTVSANFAVAVGTYPAEAAATAGTREMLYSNADGGGDGVEVGAFQLINENLTPMTVTSLEIQGSGTGDHTSAYSEFAVYRDESTGTTGAYDTGDALVGMITFAGSPAVGTLQFTGAEASIPASTTAEYYAVVKLNGTAAPMATFDFEGTALNVPSNNIYVAAPLNVMGFEIIPPVYTVTDASPSPQSQVLIGSTGNLIQEFTIEYPAGPANTIDELVFTASGTGNDANDYARVELFIDDGDAMLDESLDTSAGQATFSADDGTATFTLSGGNEIFAAGTTKRFFLVVDFNYMAQHDATFQTQLTGVNGVLFNATVNGSPSPSTATDGFIILANVMYASVNGPSATQVVDNDAAGSGDGVVLLDFTLDVNNADWSVNGVLFDAMGTGNDQLAFAELALYEDVNANGTFDGTNGDVVAATLGTSFLSDDGSWEATMNNNLFTDVAARRFFLVAKLAGTAVEGETFQVTLRSLNASPPFGGIVLTLPADSGFGLEIDTAGMEATLNGPLAASTVDNTALDQVLADVSITSRNGPFEVTELTFSASGTGNDATAFSSLQLFEDSNGNGTYQMGTDLAASAASGAMFASDDGDVSFSLINSDFSGPSDRRFFLIATLNGSATSGDTFNATLSGWANTTTTMATPTGVPTMTSTALMIDLPVLTVARALNASTALVAEKSGAAISQLVGNFVLSSSNDDVAVNGVTFTTSGTGDWVNDLDATTGVQVYMDDGDSSFDALSDTLVFEGPGAAGTLVANFSPAIDVPNNGSARFFLVFNLVGTAGGSTPLTYQATISNVANVSVAAGVNVVFGTPVPNGATLTLIEYYVSGITPVRVDPGTMGQEITITGSGFTAPVQLRIGGIQAGGFGLVSQDGTEITGFTVPAGSGVGLEIELSTGLLGPRTMTSTFSYVAQKSGGGGGGCSLEGGTQGAWLMLFLGLSAGLLLMLRKREA